MVSETSTGWKSKSSGLVLGLAVLVYISSIHGDFVFDDIEAIMSNPDVRKDTPLSEVFNHDFWGVPLSDPESHKSYRPLVVLTFRWNRMIHGMWPPGFHATNILLHALVSLLYLQFCSRIGIPPWTSLMASLLFTLHPIHAEAVANIVGRTELMAGLFFLLSLLSYQKLVSIKPSLQHQHQHPSHPTAKKPYPSSCILGLIASIAFSVPALLSKEQGVTVLGVIIAYDIFIISGKNLQDIYSSVVKIFSFRGGGLISKQFFSSSKSGMDKARSLTQRVLVVAISALVIISLRLYINGKGAPLFVESDNPASFSPHRLTRVLTYMYLCGLNAWLLLFPSCLCFDWSMGSIPLLESWTDSRNSLTLCVFVVLAGLLIRRGFNKTSVNSELLKVNSNSTINIVSSNNNNNNNNNNNERANSEEQFIPSKYHSKIKKTVPLTKSPRQQRQVVLFAFSLLLLPYLPASNLLFPVGFVVAERVLYLPSMGACLLVAIGAQSILRTNRRLVKTSLHLLLGVAMVMYGVKTARRSYEWTDIRTLSESALPVNPTNAKVYMTIGNHYAQEGRRKCELFYRAAIDLRPHYTTAWVNLGLVLLNTDRAAEAEQCYLKALAISPGHINGNTNMGHLCRLQGRWEEAKSHYNTVLLRRPRSHLVLYQLALVLQELGDMKESEHVLRRCIQVLPDYQDCSLSLARLLASTSEGGRRVEYGSYSKGKRLEEAIQLYQGDKLQNDPEIHYELGRILLHKGLLRKAEMELSLVLSLSPSHGKAHYELANVYRESGEHDRSKKHYEEAIKIDSSLEPLARTKLKEL